jgi:uncharacterized protein YndB with AHSA1/START domain
MLQHSLDRTIVIEAPRDLVFRFFTDSARWATWWGPGSTIDPRPGGPVYIRHPNGIEASGAVVESQPPDRIVFTYGFNSGTPIPPGSSRVTIELEPAARGTCLRLHHQFADTAVRDEHVQGWRYQLSVFANIVADELHGDAGRLVDAWFACWSDPDEGNRRRQLAAIAAAGVSMRDRFSSVEGLDELMPHISAAQRFMPGLRLSRHGDARHCQGTVLADWTAAGPDGQPRGRGTNVFVLGSDGLIQSVTGFWSN